MSEVERRLLEDLRSLRAPEGYLRAGSPRYHTLFGRDSLISAWQSLRVDPTIARDTLRVLASYQGHRVRPASEEEPGKILHEHRFDPASRAELPDWEFPYYGSVDSTPLFLIVGAAYVATTEDTGFLTEMWAAFGGAYRWMREFGDVDGDGFLEYARKNPRGLFHQGWKDGSDDHLRISPPVAMVEVQGYAYAAHRAFAALAGRLGESALVEEASAASDWLRGRLLRDFWLPDLRFFALALDGRKTPRRAITSNPGHLLATGILDRDFAEPVVRRLFQKDIWTPYGVRTHATSEPDFDPYGYHTGTVWPHDNWFLYRGLRAMGFREEAGRVRDALLRAYDDLGKIPELYAVVDERIVDLSAKPVRGTRANPLQAWASAGLLDIVRDVTP